MEMSEHFHNCYLNAVFSIFLSESSLDWIVSLTRYISVAWLGDSCCGSLDEVHNKPKTYVVHGISDEFITLNNAMCTQCYLYTCWEQIWSCVGFGCFNDVRPSVNPIEPLESVDFYSMNISYIEKSIFWVQLFLFWIFYDSLCIWTPEHLIVCICFYTGWFEQQ